MLFFSTEFVLKSRPISKSPYASNISLSLSPSLPSSLRVHLSLSPSLLNLYLSFILSIYLSLCPCRSFPHSLPNLFLSHYLYISIYFISPCPSPSLPYLSPSQNKFFPLPSIFIFFQNFSLLLVYLSLILLQIYKYSKISNIPTAFMGEI